MKSCEESRTDKTFKYIIFVLYQFINSGLTVRNFSYKIKFFLVTVMKDNKGVNLKPKSISVNKRNDLKGGT